MGQILVYGKAKLKPLCQRIDRLDETVSRLDQNYQHCVESLKACQQQTQQLLQQQLERHALHPAVEAVVVLAEELLRLNTLQQNVDQATDVEAARKNLTDELNISAAIAMEKLALLEIQKIVPQIKDPFDRDRHNVCSLDPTSESDLAEKVQRVVTEGILYRGQVLRQARVVAYRYCETEPQNP